MRIWAIDYWYENTVSVSINGAVMWSKMHSTEDLCGNGWAMEDDENMPDDTWGKFWHLFNSVCFISWLQMAPQ